ncbi:helix-turn-helix transcriptional regulator [Cupriavidus necator]|uniref:helix-turn-helix transcriptional regulator n=1 Tax=Cupriavidus necator TaxID=106590 RepID=UPI002786059D|nr:helix-turn-helix transcriptional regulator [Cupriavidus necator]MDQ0142899.1 DNA-binding CsgD family transcriptional regulator [Cupriavidus necator]
MPRDQLIGDLYEAAVRQDGFLETFQAVTEVLGANVFHMFSWDAARNAPHLSIYTPDVRWDEVIARYDAFYGAFDPRRRFVEQARIGQFVNCDDHLSEQDVSRSEFFQDFQIPAGFRYLMGVRLARPNSDEILLGLLRARDRSPYTQAERAAAAGMAGHLQRAINLWQDARVLHRDAALGTELMEQLGLAVFALDRHSRVVCVNAAAESALRATTRLKLEHGRLVASTAADNVGLQAAIARVAKTRQGESLALPATCGAPPDIFLSITVLPGKDTRAVFGNATMLITARQRGTTALVSARQLRQAFALSGAEAAVAEALVSGKTAEAYASSAGVSVATVRTQLRAIYEKTHTRTQTEAVGAMLWVLSQNRPER